MSANSLGSRAIIGEFYARLEQDIGNSWVPLVTNLFDSDQESETYKWLGQVPAMREWVGGRQAKGFSDNGISITNKEYEGTLEVRRTEWERDKTGQVMVRVQELAERTNAHWAKIASTLILNGAAGVCYDGQFFFDTDHSEGSSGTQSNSISVDIATTTNPTAGEMEGAILKAIEQLLSFVDNEAEPMNENAREFLVMVPVPFMSAAAAAIGSSVIVQNATAVASNRIITLGSIGGFTIRLAVNQRLSAWTTKFAVWRVDAPIKGVIRQEETPVEVTALAEGSEEEFKHNRRLYGVYARRNVGYGLWQRACLVTFT